MSQIRFRLTSKNKSGLAWKITVATEAGNDCRTKDQWKRVANGSMAKNSAVDKVLQVSNSITTSCIAIHVAAAIESVQNVRVTGWIEVSGGE